MTRIAGDAKPPAVPVIPMQSCGQYRRRVDDIRTFASGDTADGLHTQAHATCGGDAGVLFPSDVPPNRWLYAHVIGPI